MFGKDFLFADATDVANSDKVISYLRGASGTVITSTTIAGHECIDVNLASPISVSTDLNGIYNVSTNASPDNVGMVLYGRSATPGLANQTFLPTGGTANADGVVAANVQGADVNSFLMGYNGSSWDRIQVGASGAMKVNVTSFDPTAVLPITQTYNAAVKATAVTISTAASVAPTALALRKKLVIENNGTKPIYIGDSGVTTANGLKLSAGAVWEDYVGPAVAVYAVAESGSQNVRVLELA